MRLAAAPGNVRVTRRVSRLPHDSVVNVSQLITLDKSLLTREGEPIAFGIIARSRSGYQTGVGGVVMRARSGELTWLGELT